MTLEYIIPGRPVTKKNHMEMAISKDGRRFPVQNKNYKKYESFCKKNLKAPNEPITTRINLKGLYYMPDRRRVDLCNLLGATCDIFTTCKIIDDDNSKIVVSHDGSRVLYDKENPRAEITITEAEDET